MNPVKCKNLRMERKGKKMPNRLGRKKQKDDRNKTSYFLVRESNNLDDEVTHRPVELQVGAILGRNVSAFSKDLKKNRIDIGILRIADGVSRECFEVLEMDYNGLRMLVNSRAKNKMEFLVDGLKFNAVSGTEQVLCSGDKIVFDAFCKPPIYTYVVRHASEIDFSEFNKTTKKKKQSLISKMLKRNRAKKSKKNQRNYDQKPTYIFKKEPNDYFQEDEEGPSLISEDSAYSSDSPYVSDAEKVSVTSSSNRSEFSSASSELDERIRRSSRTSSLSSGHFLESNKLYSGKGSMDYEDEDDLQFQSDDNRSMNEWEKELESNAYVPAFPQKYQTLTKEAYQLYPRPNKEIEQSMKSEQNQSLGLKTDFNDLLRENEQRLIDEDFEHFSSSTPANNDRSQTDKPKVNRDERDRRRMRIKDLKKSNSNMSMSSTKGYSRTHQHQHQHQQRDSKGSTNPRSVFAKTRVGKNGSTKKVATMDLIARRLEDPNRKSLTRSKSDQNDDISVKSADESVKSTDLSVASYDMSVTSQDLSVASKKRVQRMRAAQQLYPNGKPVASSSSNLRKSYSLKDADDLSSDFDDVSVLTSTSVESRDTVTIAPEAELPTRTYDNLLQAHLRMEKKHSGQRSIVDTLDDLDSESSSSVSSEKRDTTSNESADIASDVNMNKNQNVMNDLPPSITFDLQNSRERLKNKKKLQPKNISTQRKIDETNTNSNQPSPQSISKTLRNGNTTGKSPPKVDIHTHSIVESILYKKKVIVNEKQKSGNELPKKSPTNTLQNILNQSMIVSNMASNDRDIRHRSMQMEAKEALPKKEKIEKDKDQPIKKTSKDGLSRKTKIEKDTDLPVEKKSKEVALTADKVSPKRKIQQTNRDGIDLQAKNLQERNEDGAEPQNMESNQTETNPTDVLENKPLQMKKDEIATRKKKGQRKKKKVVPEEESHPTKKEEVLPSDENVRQTKKDSMNPSENMSNQIKIENKDVMSPISVLDLEPKMNEEENKNSTQHADDENSDELGIDREIPDDDFIGVSETVTAEPPLSKEAETVEVKKDANETEVYENEQYEDQDEHEESIYDNQNLSGSFDRLLEFAAAPGKISLGDDVYDDLDRVKKLNIKRDIDKSDNFQQKKLNNVNDDLILDDDYDQLNAVRGDSQDDLYDLTSDSSTSDNFDESSGSESSSSSVSDLSASVMSVDEYIDAQNMYSNAARPDLAFHGSDSSSNSPAREYRRRVNGDIIRSRGVMAYRGMTNKKSLGKRKPGQERFKFLEDIYVGSDDESIVSSLCLSEQQNFEDIASMDLDDEEAIEGETQEVKEQNETNLLNDFDGSEINSDSQESDELLLSNAKSKDSTKPFQFMEWNKILDGIMSVFSLDDKGKEEKTKGDSQSKSVLSTYSKTSNASKKSKVSWADDSYLSNRGIRKKSRVPPSTCNICVWTDQIKQHYKPKLSQGFT